MAKRLPPFPTDTQPDHPFTDLPDVCGQVTKHEKFDEYEIKLRCGITIRVNSARSEIVTAFRAYFDDDSAYSLGKTPNEAFQALRAAVREMAEDLGVV